MKKMTKFWMVSVATLAFQGGVSAYDRVPSVANNNLTGWDLRGGFDLGYGADRLDIKAGPANAGNDANGSLIKAEIKNAESWKFNPQLTASYNNGFYAELKGTFGFVSNGGETHAGFNAQTGALVNRSTSSLDGDSSIGGSLTVGYNIIPLFSGEIRQWNVKPLIGGEMYRQKFSTRDQVVGTAGVDNIGTNTRYNNDWNAFFAGLSVGYDFNEQLNATVRGRYSWADFNGNAGRISLKSSNSNTYGYGFGGTLSYKLFSDFDLVAGADWTRFRADKVKAAFNGITTTNGTTTWDAFSATAGFRYRFW